MDPKSHHVVYKTINNVTYHYYYGVHSTNNVMDSYIGSGSKLREALRQYGRAAFSCHILAIYTVRHEAYAHEREIVNELLVADPMCYNVALGGNMSSEDTLKRKSLSLRGHTVSLETRAKISAANKGKAGCRRGVTLSEETRRKISETRKARGSAVGPNNPNHGKEHSSETRSKMRKPHLKARGVPKPVFTCPLECGRRIPAQAMSRHVAKCSGPSTP